MFDRFAVHQPPHNTQEDIMFTRIPRTGSHLRAAARQGAARPRRLAAALIAVTCAFLASAIVPAASAAELVREPPGGAPLAPVPAPAAPVVAVGGMPGWQITLIAVSAALVTAIAAVFLDRMLAARRSASSTTA